VDILELIEKGKVKRYFRAKRKLNAPNLVYHITQRAAGKETLFVEDGDYLAMLSLLKEVSADYSFRIFAFCFMPNHVHLLCSPENANLHDAMRDLFSGYARRFNKKYERKGHLFGGPYRQAVILDEGYLLASSLYIHLNPTRAGLATDPLIYRWSSCRLYCEERQKSSFVQPDFVLKLLGQDVEMKRSYRILLKRGMELDAAHVMEQGSAIEHFGSRLRSIFPAIFQRIAERKSHESHIGEQLISSEEVDQMCEGAKMSRSTRRPETKKARKYLIEQLLARGYRRKEIGERLGLSRKSIYNILKP